jgi:UDP-GlcNAc3NAcA epimerase
MTNTSRPLALFFGTRPQVIKASVLRQAFATTGPVLAVDTGQHYDYQLHQVHYDQLGVAPPDCFLGVGSASHAEQTAAILTAAGQWIEEQRPRAAVVIGDTNSTLACALAAAKARVPVAHVEAGLRAADALMAEEINRRVVDAFATVLFAPGARAEQTLRRERPDAEVHRVGDVAYDVLWRALPLAPRLGAVKGYEPAWGGDYVYATLHRAELVDDAALLRPVMTALAALPLPVLFAAHPRTAAALERLGWHAGDAPRLKLREPLGYLESLAVLNGARAVVTDSGGIQREAYWLGVPCVTVRTETEWTETLEAGANRLLPPLEAQRLSDAVAEAGASRSRGWDRTAYGDGHAAERVAAVLAARF